MPYIRPVDFIVDSVQTIEYFLHQIVEGGNRPFVARELAKDLVAGEIVPQLLALVHNQ
jgi:hypothetical protein